MLTGHIRILFAAMALLLPATPSLAAAKPNILLVVVDDLGYGELGCQGNPQIPTPHIDSLARNGVRFTDGYVSAPVCCPSRAGYLTGRYQTRFGHEHNAIGLQNLDPGIGLPTPEKTLADLLRAAGYRTGLVGKWHLGATKPRHPLSRGFEEFYGFLHEGHFYVPPPYPGVVSWFRVKSLSDGAGPRLRKGNYVFSTHMGNTEPPYDLENPIRRGWDTIEEPGYLTDALAREAVSFIDRHADEPFFLYLAYNVPHSPLQATFESMKRHQSIPDIHRQIFAGMISILDDSFGRVLEALRRNGIEENTLIVFFSDNGGPTRELTSSNAPLRAGKGNVYEGGIRIPFLMQWKGTVPGGEVYRQPVISLDTVPTALTAAGAEVPENLDGVDLVPFVTGKRKGAPHESLFWRYGRRMALRAGDWKLVRNPVGRNADASFELYNLKADISEENDLAGESPEILRRLQREFNTINAEMVDPLWRSRGSGAKENWPLDLIR
ncbi:MAG: sulfatase-like hydrolase/transferase [bacterium]|nr:sulfatase-like hydrolase/transferase [bacterium]